MTVALKSKPLAVDGLPQPLSLRESQRARRMTLRVNSARGVVELIVPPNAATGDVDRFIGKNFDWLQRQFVRLSVEPLRFEAGTRVPVLGSERTIRHDPKHRGAGRIDGESIVVGGDPTFLARRVRDTLIDEAKRHLAARSAEFAARMGLKVARVSVRDTHSRWGSCSAKARLSFSWRLIMAPEWVVDYVVAHEVGHLVEMNHSARFWAVVAKMSGDAIPARRWLRTSGSVLMRYG